MNLKTGDKRQIGGLFLKIVILSVSLMTMMINCISVSLGSIQDSFPQVSTVRLQCLLAYATFSMMICVLASGILVSWLGTRKILLTGLLLYTVSGVMPMFLKDFQHILMARVAMGAGQGLFHSLAVGLITDFYEGDERAAVMGQQFAVGNLGQTIALIAVGLLSTISWRYGFLVYGMGGLVFLLNLLFLPEKPAEKRKAGEPGSISINGPALCVGVIMGFYNMVYIIMYSNLSLVMKSQHIGTSMTVSCSMAVMTLVSIGAGMSFGRLYDRLGELLGVLSSLVITGTFSLLMIADRPWMIYLALALLGLGNALIMPYGFYHTSRVCPPQAAKFCLSISQTLLSLGSFLSPFVVDGLRKILGQNGDRFPFVAGLTGMGILNLILLIYWLASRKRAA